MQWLRLNRPPAHNAFDAALRPEIAVVVLAGALANQGGALAAADSYASSKGLLAEAGHGA